MTNEKTKVATEQQLQQMYMQFQMMKQQMDEAIQSKQILDQKMAEIIGTKNAIKDLKKAKKGSEMWAPLGSESFVMAELKDVSNIAVSVGANVVVKKSAAEALKIMDKKEKELQDLDKQLMSHIEYLQSQMQSLERVMQNAIASAQGTNVSPDNNKNKSVK